MLGVLAAMLLGVAPAEAKVPKHFFGVLADGPVFSEEVDLDRELRAMRSAGVQVVRTPFYGDRVQSSPSAPLSLASTDPLVLAAARAGVRVLPVVLSVPPWARRTPGIQFSGPTAGAGRDFYVAYLRALIRRYGPGGSLWLEHPELIERPIRRWQVWNEPEGLRFWHEPPRIEQYVKLLRVASPAIRKLDPGAKVILGGLVSEGRRNLKRIYALGARKLFDQVAIHPFTFGVPNVLRLVRRTRKVMGANGDAAKPIALTEVSWPTAYKKIPKERAYGFEVTEREQALRVDQVYRTMARHRKELSISTVAWASWMSVDRGVYPFDYSGLRRLTRGNQVVRKPGYFAFRKVARALSR